VLIGQIQAPEDVRPSPPRPAPQPAPTPQPTINTTTPVQPGADANALPTIVTTPPPPTPTVPPPRITLFRLVWDHIRTDPSARMCKLSLALNRSFDFSWRVFLGAIMSFFLVVVFRLVIALSIPLVFIGALYCSLWAAQIYRAVRRGRTSGLTAEYLIGTTVCRLYYLLCKFFFSLSLCWLFYGVNW
jgi:transmembrane E3 ubiquitin-protein ligase